jgi:very-short-patch-repair endonuclease
VPPIQPALVALAAIGPPAALCGVTAAAHYGWQLAEPPDLVHLVVPQHRGPQLWRQVAIHRWRLTAGDVVQVGDTYITAPLRTALDVAATAALPQALALLDFLLRSETLDEEQLEDAVLRADKRPGSLRARTVVALADRRRASAAESVFRARVHEAGLPPPREQFPVRLNGRFVGRADFAWPMRRVLVEIDGYAYHSDVRSFLRDRRRQNELVMAGWRVLRFAASDVLTRPEMVIAEVRAALTLPLPRTS